MALHLLYSAFSGMYRGVMVGNVRRGAHRVAAPFLSFFALTAPRSAPRKVCRMRRKRPLLRDESKSSKKGATQGENNYVTNPRAAKMRPHQAKKEQHHNNTKSGKNTATPDESGNPRTIRTAIHNVTLLRDASKGSKKEATPSEKMRKVSNATTLKQEQETK
jgi:hypothetical protein